MLLQEALKKLTVMLETENIEGGDVTFSQLAEDLLDWYNVAEPDKNDIKLLFKLVSAGLFQSWDCPTCGDRVYEGSPEDWGNFQGVWQVDYASYPEGHHTQCDNCRAFRPWKNSPE